MNISSDSNRCQVQKQKILFHDSYSKHTELFSYIACGYMNATKYFYGYKRYIVMFYQMTLYLYL